MVPESDDEGEKKSVKKKRKRKKSSARKASDGSAAESDAESKKKIKEEGQALVDFSIKVCQAKESGEFRPANTIIDPQVDFPTLGAQLSTFKGTTKPAFATAIVQFIQDARTITCLKCSLDYSPYSSENTTSEVVCLMCCRPGHLGCYADTLIDEETGILFLCSICLPAKKNPAPDSQVAPPVELEPADNTKLKTTAPLSERLASDSDPSDKKLLQDSEYDRSKPVCPLLLKHE
ncbi:unnamed protein product [Boreogadus saida]